MGHGSLGGEGGAGGSLGPSGYPPSSCPYFSFDSAAGDSPRGHFLSGLNLANWRGWESVSREVGAGVFRSGSGALGAECDYLT